jgi:hypothetical protein
MNRDHGTKTAQRLAIWTIKKFRYPATSDGNFFPGFAAD